MISFKVVIGSLFGLMVAAIAVLGIFFYQDSQDRVTAAGRVSHAHQVIRKTEEISSTFKSTQLKAIQLVDLRDAASASEYEIATRNLYARMAELLDLISGNSSGVSIDSLHADIQNFIQVSNSLKVKRGTGPEVGKALKAMPYGVLARRIEERIEHIKDVQENMLAERNQALQERVAAFMRTLSMLTVTVGILLAATFLTVRYNFNKRKAAEDQIKSALEAEVQLNRMKSSFVTLASHEFRTPLTTILSSTFLLEKYSFGVNQDKAAKHLARIKSSVSNLTSILDEFLSVTKIEEGQIQPNIEAVDLPAFLKNVCNDLQTFAKAGQTIQYSHTGSQEVKTDPVLLGNIIRNIVTNSIKYSPENSIIYVSSAINSKVHLSVKDNGIGIPAPDQKNLFQRFYRASNAGAVQGTGLGLHIMKHYVQMLNGFVKLESEIGKGTIVEVTFDHTTPD